MLPVRQITPPDWMTDYRTVRVMQVLGAYEIPAQSLFVGGCVRNLFVGQPVTDIDIATTHHPLQVIERLSSKGIRYVPTGLDHGTVTAIVDDAVFEITTLRKDIDTDGRHAVIAFTERWDEDAQRRDFTINTLLAAPDGMVFDPLGTGLEDLDARRVRFVGKPEDRIAEDYLRILRFFRFYAIYGEGAPDADAIEASRANAESLSKLSRERVTQEVLKIAASAKAPSVLSMMFGLGVLRDLGAAYEQAKLSRLCEFQSRYNAPDILARLFLVTGDSEEAVARWLILSNAQKKHLAGLRHGVSILKSISRKKIREAVYACGNAMAVQAYFLSLIQRGELPDLDLLDIAFYWQAPTFPVRAQTLMDSGVSPGPFLGQQLKDLEERWIAADFPADFSFKK